MFIVKDQLSHSQIINPKLTNRWKFDAPWTLMSYVIAWAACLHVARARAENNAYTIRNMKTMLVMKILKKCKVYTTKNFNAWR